MWALRSRRRAGVLAYRLPATRGAAVSERTVELPAEDYKRLCDGLRALQRQVFALEHELDAQRNENFALREAIRLGCVDAVLERTR